MAKKTKPLEEIIKTITQFLDSDVEFVKNNNNDEATAYLANPTGLVYTNLINAFVHERFVQIKVRDPDSYLEYQIDLLPWRMGINYNIWNDGKGSSIVIMKSASFVNDDAEYFQKMTVEDNLFFSVEELIELRNLMYRMYELGNITPCRQEQ